MKGQTNIIFALLFALIVAIFAVINVEPVEVNYLFGTGDFPLILVILISVLTGGIITAAVGSVRLFRLQRENRSLRQEIDQHKQLSDKNEENKNNVQEDSLTKEEEETNEK